MKITKRMLKRLVQEELSHVIRIKEGMIDREDEAAGMAAQGVEDITGPDLERWKGSEGLKLDDPNEKIEDLKSMIMSAVSFEDLKIQLQDMQDEGAPEDVSKL
jgi:hypothetical protein